MRLRLGFSLVLLSLLLLSGCGVLEPLPAGSRGGVDGPGVLSLAAAPAAVEVQNLPKSRIGNRSTYTVFGKQYRVLDSAADFSEQGVASWYGSKFHGRDTSSGEVYNMYAMTAAHKHLPLPTFVKVTHRDTGKSIVVKVNDRGPFVGDRVIDLSYAAAHQLGMLGTGTANVEIVALSTHLPTGSDKSLISQVQNGSAEQPLTTTPKKSNTFVAETPLATPAQTHYIQLGAFRHQPNAESLKQKVASSLPLPTRIQHDVENALFRVRVGPVENQTMLSDTLTALASTGVEQYKLIQVAR